MEIKKIHTSSYSSQITSLSLKEFTSSSSSPYFTAPQLCSSYNVPVVKPVPGAKRVKIVIIIAYTCPSLKSDLATYWKLMYGNNAVPPIVNVQTMYGAKVDSGWSMEECLDVQMVCAMNPNADIWVVEAVSSSLFDLSNAIQYATVKLKPDVISMSWGANDNPGFSAYSSYFSNPSICYCASSGDSNTASWPSSLPNVISVGGTTLSFQGNTRNETTWSSAGSGYTSQAMPSYQSLYLPQSISVNKTKRIIPDVSLVGNPSTGVLVVYKGNLYAVGGTSVSAPLFAGMMSLANQMRFNVSKKPLTSVSQIQTFLYKSLTSPTTYSQQFYDVIVGTNKGSSTNNVSILQTFSAGKGFDIPTGLGSPNCDALCKALVNL